MLHIHNLFEVIAKHKYGSVTKKIMFSILSDIMNLRYKMGIKNDVYFLEKRKDEVIEKLSGKYPDISYILEDIFEIPEVRAYLDIKQEVKDQDDDFTEDDFGSESDSNEMESDEESNDDGSESDDISDDETISDTTVESANSFVNYVVLPRSTLVVVVFTSLVNLCIGGAISLRVFNVL